MYKIAASNAFLWYVIQRAVTKINTFVIIQDP